MVLCKLNQDPTKQFRDIFRGHINEDTRQKVGDLLHGPDSNAEPILRLLALSFVCVIVLSDALD